MTKTIKLWANNLDGMKVDLGFTIWDHDGIPLVPPGFYWDSDGLPMGYRWDSHEVSYLNNARDPTRATAIPELDTTSNATNAELQPYNIYPPSLKTFKYSFTSERHI